MSGFSFLEAIAYAEKRGIVLPEEYYGKLAGLQRQQAVSIAGLGTIEQIKFVIDKLNDTLKGGGTFKEFQDAVRAGSLNIDMPKHRLDNIFRTNMQVAYNRGRWEQQTRVSGARPYLMYSAINDTRVRPTHLAWDNLVLPRGDPFWVTHYPPNGYRCRCTAISLSKTQAEKRGISKASPAGDPDKGWDYNPGADYVPAVTKLVDKKLDKLPPAMKAGAGKLKDNIAEKKAEVAKPPAHLEVADRFAKGYRIGRAVTKELSDLEVALETAYNTGKLDKVSEISSQLRMLRLKEKARVKALLFTDRSTWSDIGTVVKTDGLSARLKGKVAEAEDWVRKFVGVDVRPKGLKVKVLPGNGRAYADPRTREIAISEDATVSTIVHEIAHHIEFDNPKVLKRVSDFFNRRTEHNKLKKLSELTGNKGFRDDEIAFEDHWAAWGGSPYMGKWYGGKCTEILSMGIERMLLDPEEFYRRDPDYFAFMLEVFHG